MSSKVDVTASTAVVAEDCVSSVDAVIANTGGTVEGYGMDETVSSETNVTMGQCGMNATVGKKSNCVM